MLFHSQLLAKNIKKKKKEKKTILAILAEFQALVKERPKIFTEILFGLYSQPNFADQDVWAVLVC